MMKSKIAWPEMLFAASILCGMAVAGSILWLDSPIPSGVVALLASIPFLIVARFAWGRMRVRRTER